MNESLRYGLIIAGSLIIAFLAVKVIARGGHDVGNAASKIESKF